jgi:hypothetical protein
MDELGIHPDNNLHVQMDDVLVRLAALEVKVRAMAGSFGLHPVTNSLAIASCVCGCFEAVISLAMAVTFWGLKGSFTGVDWPTVALSAISIILGFVAFGQIRARGQRGSLIAAIGITGGCTGFVIFMLLCVSVFA